MNIDLNKIPCFGIAGNFTGHLEQAGEAEDFKKLTSKDAAAPKGIFPTYIPAVSEKVPAFLSEYPFTDSAVVFPDGEQNIQMEPECGMVFDFTIKDGKVTAVSPVCFAASNDCTIRRAGAKKISIKKNWGKNSKGVSSNFIVVNDFSPKGNIADYRIASYLLRNGEIFEYGENSSAGSYSYFYDTLNEWIADRFNFQRDEDPLENIGLYLKEFLRQSGKCTASDGSDRNCMEQEITQKVFISVGSTRYTQFGQSNYLKAGDVAAIILYPQKKYSSQEVISIIRERIQNGIHAPEDISLLTQEICVG